MEELIKRLESVDTQESAKVVSRLQKRLGSTREPQLLGDLVDYFIASGSPRALRVLASLKDVQSQVEHGRGPGIAIESRTCCSEFKNVVCFWFFRRCRISSPS